MANYPGGWFGKSWGAPVCEESLHLPTPVGDLCIECAQTITEDDQGLLIPFAGMTPAVLCGYHLDCFLKTIIPNGVRVNDSPSYRHGREHHERPR